ncbi:adenylyl-sulfate kinase [Candidatus Marinimicrobia bacterium]|nr:adenylyl-sulfate kinase [Candidatus Neomarinimicrobiota bacterium]
MINKIIWLTGQPGSGKTTLANHLKDKIELSYPNKPIMIVDGDDLRDITVNKDYSRKGRESNIRSAQKIAKFLYNKNFITIVALVAPYRDLREEFKKFTPVLEVFLCTTEIRGREHFFAEDYEPPEANFLNIDTGIKTEEECTLDILSALSD